MEKATLTLSSSANAAELVIPWQHGHWNFNGRSKPVAGTLVIVEESEAGQTVVGTATSFYDMSLVESKR